MLICVVIQYAIRMSRGKKDLAGALLEEIAKAPNTAPTRLFGRVGINCSYGKNLVQNGLIEFEQVGRKRTRVSMTEKGRTFLTHYRICNELLPS